ncbi:MAG: bifunctional diaminohydroxyphosphoribosylaminopyrimidine deaminase/5-amino-6-(5-phosphoribosylamino)uracil reductase RibD [Candidatus Gastranaerophilales bacterium]|nr:bifunctional diaminohydroxyphosphoribosylaminopyrimidine deaminase/5-amino-6-(5-phosphoribosylamino)uracil reductase RibD [Candidatus Gastranaerophilales bacterium]
MMFYDNYMKQCIKLAKKGAGKTAPNPLVGCVVLDKDGKILSTGYHHRYGENHAERDALLKLKNGEEAGGVLIVNLEPCSHYGKTPPCADLIIERKLKRVVIGCCDTNPKVNGHGIEKLKNAGIEVITGVLEKECRNLNEVFFTNIEKKRPFVVLKTASTLDGKIATENGNSKWITSEKSRNYAKKLRSKYDAILTSSQTVIADNPQMMHKTKIILDTNLRTDFNSKIYKTGKIILAAGETIQKPKIIPANVMIMQCKTVCGKISLIELLQRLYEYGITSIFVECGGMLGGSFIKQNLADKIYHFTAPKILNDNNGKSCFSGDKIDRISDCKNYEFETVKKIGDDIMLVYKKYYLN